jgi:hypothetical protein
MAGLLAAAIEMRVGRPVHDTSGTTDDAMAGATR